MERLPAGFRFDPTDDEVLIYLSCKVSGNPLPCHGCVTEGDIYDEKQLHQIFSQIKRGGRPEYFFTQLKKKGKEGCRRFDRTVGKIGNWHATQTKKILDQSGENVVGFLKSFVFKGDEEDHWNMDEFSLSNKNDYVLCRIKNNRKRKFGDCSDDNGEAAVPVPVPDLEPVTKAAKHDRFLTASTSYYLNNPREEDAPLISPASCSILLPPISSGPSLTDCGTDMGKDDNAVWDDIQNPLAMEGGAFDSLRSDILAAEQNLCTNSGMPLAAAEAAALPDVNSVSASAMADLMADLDGFDTAAFADLSFLDALIGSPDIGDDNYSGEFFDSHNFQRLEEELMNFLIGGDATNAKLPKGIHLEQSCIDYIKRLDKQSRDEDSMTQRTKKKSPLTWNERPAGWVIQLRQHPNGRIDKWTPQPINVDTAQAASSKRKMTDDCFEARGIHSEEPSSQPPICTPKQGVCMSRNF
ncbi:hypothetical protein RJ639_030717 [Escallonia herrerae]|uniref:NAC domain-containing protein n=1 Tax=Escallonia herrerae TaxID=1293975 RepID=A0AA89BE69_9ASTE|nr:hypothetical protein RJ639_030717 [Escallonia herrerae]